MLRRARLASDDDEIVLQEVEKRKATEAQKTQTSGTTESSTDENSNT